MSAPIEFRLFAKLFGMPDLQAGVQPIRLGPQIFCPAVLQYRFKQRISTGGKVEMDWSDWQGVPMVYEGMTGAPLQPFGTAAGPETQPPANEPSKT